MNRDAFARRNRQYSYVAHDDDALGWADLRAGRRRRWFARVTLVLIAGLAAAGFALFLGSRGDATFGSAPWDKYSVSKDGHTLTLWVQDPSDRGCSKWGRIQLEERGDVLVATAQYRRTDQEFCNVPCSLSTTPHTQRFDIDLRKYKIVPLSGVSDCRKSTP